MALRPEDLDLGQEEVTALIELQGLIDLKLKRFSRGANWPDPTIDSPIDRRIPLTFSGRPSQRVIDRCERIYTALGWNIAALPNRTTLLIMIGPAPTPASPS